MQNMEILFLAEWGPDNTLAGRVAMPSAAIKYDLASLPLQHLYCYGDQTFLASLVSQLPPSIGCSILSVTGFLVRLSSGFGHLLLSYCGDSVLSARLSETAGWKKC